MVFCLSAPAAVPGINPLCQAAQVSSARCRILREVLDLDVERRPHLPAVDDPVCLQLGGRDHRCRRTRGVAVRQDADEGVAVAGCRIGHQELEVPDVAGAGVVAEDAAVRHLQLSVALVGDEDGGVGVVGRLGADQQVAARVVDLDELGLLGLVAVLADPEVNADAGEVLSSILVLPHGVTRDG